MRGARRILSAGTRFHQMVTRWEGSSHIASPGVTSKARAKVSRLRSTWLQRNSAGEWGSIASIWRANWGRVAVRQARAHE